MRRLIVMIGAVACLVLAASAVAAGGGGKATGGVKYITTAGNEAQTSFNAQGTPEAAKGHLTQKLVNPVTGEEVSDIRGEVTCYFQDGNLARFSGPITKRKADDQFPGDYFMVAVQDNGEGSKAPPDMIGNGRFMTQPDCSQPTVLPVRTVDKGSIQVHQGK